ncbi:MAG: hypothetical protein OHK0028_07760 [Deltaproteobacteria bacterium]
MEGNDQPRDPEQGNPPVSLAEAVIASLALRDLYGIRRLYPDALAVDDAREIHRQLVERLNAALGDPRFCAIRENLYCEPCFDDALTEGKLSLTFAALVAHCPDVQVVGASEKAIAGSIDQGVKWSHDRCSEKLQDLLLQLFEIKNHDYRNPSPKDEPTFVDTPRSEQLGTAGSRMIEKVSGLPDHDDSAYLKKDGLSFQTHLPSDGLGASYLSDARVHLDGRAKKRRHLVTIDGQEIWLTERSFDAALKLALVGKRTALGWMDCDRLGSIDSYHQVIRRLKKALKGSGIDVDQLVENNGAKQYRFSVPPFNITLDEAMIRRHVTGAKKLFEMFSY